jgi:hypothetical protein
MPQLEPERLVVTATQTLGVSGDVKTVAQHSIVDHDLSLGLEN